MKKRARATAVPAVLAPGAAAAGLPPPQPGGASDADGAVAAAQGGVRRRPGRVSGLGAKPPAVKRTVEGSGEPTGVTLNHLDVATGKGAIAALSRDRRTLTGVKGYKMVRATRGVSEGTWFCEWTVQADSKPGGHVRLGWANECADAHAAVGFDEHSYALRDASGSRVHQSIRTPYCSAASVGPGDVIGCLITFETPRAELEAALRSAAGAASAGPADGWRVRQAQAAASRPGATRVDLESILFQPAPPRPLPWCSASEQQLQGGEWGDPAAAARALGSMHHASLLLPRPATSTPSSSSSGGAPDPTWQPGDNPPKNQKRAVYQRYWGSSIRFFVNGVDQGVAFLHLTREHKYYPAASCYDGGAVRFNPGPAFAFPPPGGPPAPAAAAAASDTEEQRSSSSSSASQPALAVAAASSPPPSAAGAPGERSVAAVPSSSGPEEAASSAAWGQWRPICQLETEGAGGDTGTGTLLDLLRLPYRDAREPSLEGLQSMLAAGRASSAPVTFAGAATASYASSLGFGGRGVPLGSRAPMGPLGLPMSTITHRAAALPQPAAGNKAVELLQRANAAAAAARLAHSSKS